MVDWSTIIISLTLVFGMLSAFYLGAKLSHGEKILPSAPGKLEIFEPDEVEDKYGPIFPKDLSIFYPENNEGDNAE